MAKRIELSDIAITHISLVKAGANGKEIIYKSADEPGGYENTINIKKTDEEKGIVYGIVYAPGEVDSQGDFANAEEIEKAAYGFMKSLNAKNVDLQHSFNNEDAFVAESWLVKGGDPIFGNEPEGSWAVAIKLESEELKALAKSGEIGGLSMAGQAKKTEVEKSEGGAGSDAFKKFFEAFADVATDMWVDFGVFIKKGKGEEMSKEFGEIIKKKLEDATKEAGNQLSALKKSNEEQGEKIAALEKVSKEAGESLETLKNEHSEAIEALKKEHGEAIETLKKEHDEVVEQLKKSAQDTAVKKSEEKEKDTKGVM